MSVAKLFSRQLKSKHNYLPWWWQRHAAGMVYLEQVSAKLVRVVGKMDGTGQCEICTTLIRY